MALEVLSQLSTRYHRENAVLFSGVSKLHSSTSAQSPKSQLVDLMTSPDLTFP